jgi:hypothetical protein
MDGFQSYLLHEQALGKLKQENWKCNTSCDTATIW